MNGFEKHGVTHLSPSQINTYLESPGYWVATKLLGNKTIGSAAMNRGIVVEDAVAAVLMSGKEVADAKRMALESFDMRCAYLPDLEKTAKERESIEAMVDQGLEALDGFPELIPPPEDSKQHKIELTCRLDDGSAITIIGYLDFAFGGNMKKVVDLKTTLRMPSNGVMSMSHKIQRCVYKTAVEDGWDVDFLYVTPKKHAMLTVPDEEHGKIMAQVKAVANQMNRLLKVSDDPEEIASIASVNPGSFYWSGADAREIREKVFGY